MFKPIKSPVGETVSDDSYDKGVEYMTEKSAQNGYFWYRMYYSGLIPATFADWLEAQGGRLV